MQTDCDETTVNCSHIFLKSTSQGQVFDYSSEFAWMYLNELRNEFMNFQSINLQNADR